ncbi:NCS2 family permease [Hazenella coriacea]|uniref:AGZA family xanthine/uracil permease-like MFS transporter n=1 Tax=Hazenella coriacea TaxID=1179467 RepID=A0A4R3L1H7_9BACL|nr:NCS2 family permease [Hazenella coriacea]TCS93421.1 AGZA family xanthine/uracil permease-like MFS transporter [Hazenella coriacea]
MNIFESLFQLKHHQTNVKRELLAGLTTYVTVVYILIVNGYIIADSGIPLQAAILATAFTSVIGCVLMGFWANAPVILVPGMGVNAFFTYTIVHKMGLTWQEALAVVAISGLMFMLIAFTRLSKRIVTSIPDSLRKSITVGIGLLITFIGLQKGGLVQASKETFVTMGDLHQPVVALTLGSLLLTIVLYARNVKGSFLISLLITTIVAVLMGIRPSSTTVQSLSLDQYLTVVGSLSFSKMTSLPFWMATFILTMILVFENVGLLQGLLKDKKQFPAAFQANALSAFSAGLLGTSPTVCAVESATGIAAGGRTGLTPFTTGFLLLGSVFLIPFIQWIPDSAIASILVIVGGLMIGGVKDIPFNDLTEGIPAFFTIALIPFTYSIPDGIALGFITYAILKITTGKWRQLTPSFYLITSLFVIQLIFS